MHIKSTGNNKNRKTKFDQKCDNAPLKGNISKNHFIKLSCKYAYLYICLLQQHNSKFKSAQNNS